MPNARLLALAALLGIIAGELVARLVRWLIERW